MRLHRHQTYCHHSLTVPLTKGESRCCVRLIQCVCVCDGIATAKGGNTELLNPVIVIVIVIVIVQVSVPV